MEYMQLNHFFNKNFSNSSCKVRVFDMNEVAIFAKSLSTTTKITSLSFDLGRLIIKSTLIFSHFAIGIGKG